MFPSKDPGHGGREAIEADKAGSSPSHTCVSKQSVKVTYPNLELDSLFISEHSFYFEIDPDGADECGREGVVRVAEQKGSFAHTAVANNEQFEHVVKVLI